MKEFLIWAFLSGLLFFSLLAIIIFGLLKKKRKFLFIALTTLLFLIGTISWTVYLFVSKSYNKITTMLEPRTGKEIYFGLFGKTDNKCLKILNHQDQVIPKIDYAIWLHFETCPEELKRILKLHDFQKEIQPTEGWNTEGPLSHENWFKPERLGKIVLVFKYKKDDYGNGQTIYSSLDSTEVYCIDVLD